ncbi:conserved exported hypothetical protein [Capnocytophaga canimorsus]|uniref:Lipocalin-like domain-containing protein n=1 Tax=Capnocytophaga canimorsus TaxID=28188 RepID=A0A0B7I697_9FLAO|nr:lipocalin family protein [Capnocytophaga canimorsus]CEN47180.1 conserved exported hypothetical protein [Capnocytophaga canimorsus]
MKRILTFVVAILAISLYSCGKDDKKNETPANPFAGTWVLESYTRNDIDKTTDCVRKERVIFTDNTITIDGYYVKTPDNSCEKDELVELTYTYTNNKISAKEKKSNEVVDSFMTFRS